MLPRRERAHLLAIYGFARLVDELGDARPTGRPRWRRSTGWSASSTGPSQAQRRAPAAGARCERRVRECALAREPFARLIEANRVDQRVSRYETWEQLRGYCALSADPVGELVLGVFGAGDARADRAVGLDLHGAAAGRALPGRRRGPRRAGASTCRSRTSRASAATRRTSRRDHASGRAARGARVRGRARTRAARRAARRCSRELRGRPRLAVAAFVAGGRAALDAIERARYDVLAGPPRAGRARALRGARAAHACARSRSAAR